LRKTVKTKLFTYVLIGDYKKFNCQLSLLIKSHIWANIGPILEFFEILKYFGGGGFIFWVLGSLHTHKYQKLGKIFCHKCNFKVLLSSFWWFILLFAVKFDSIGPGYHTGDSSEPMSVVTLKPEIVERVEVGSKNSCSFYCNSQCVKTKQKWF
jgi:hypothetical protein